MTLNTKEDFQGLTENDVQLRIDKGLTNFLPKKTTRSIWNIVKSNLLTFFNFIVIGSFSILFALGQWKDALFGIAAIVNVLIGITQEYRSKRLLDKLALIHAPKAKVIRDWQIEDVDIDDIVMDDVILLSGGDQIPVDAVVVKSRGLEVNEALLTGEIDPIRKEVDDKVLSGSMVVAGSAYIKTIIVGEQTFASRLSVDAKRFSLVHSELRAGIDKVLKLISMAIIPIMLIVIYGQITSQGGWSNILSEHILLDTAVGAIASIVAMIPLGLILITSVAYAAAAIKLLRKNVLLQEIAAVEGLARADVVCFDKTGTLTEGEITFDNIKLFNNPKKSYKNVVGWFAYDGYSNATMKALQNDFADKTKLEPNVLIHFSSSRKWSGAAFHDGPAEGSWVLGAPEKLYDPNKDGNEEVSKYIAELSDKGRRVLLLSYHHEDFKHVKVDEDDIRNNFIPVAVISLRETIRTDARQTLDFLSKQGVAVRILSGDSPSTVAAIAKEVGLNFKGNGYDARKLPDDKKELAEILDNNVVFGRVNPEQKKSIVMALQSKGHVVAMVGDGVNDAMAVKQADLGIAIGSGSAATRAVSRLVILDGDFAKFPNIVAQGRQVIANIERVAMLFLSKTTYIVMFSIIFGLLSWGFPLLPRHLSAIDGLTIGIPSLILALLPSNQRYNPGFLKRTLIRAIPNGILIALSVVFLRIYASSSGVVYPEYALATAITLVVTLCGIWILVTQSRPLNIVRLSLIGAMYVSLIGMLYIPLFTDFFAFVMPQAELLRTSLIISALGCIGIELINQIVIYLQKKKSTS